MRNPPVARGRVRSNERENAMMLECVQDGDVMCKGDIQSYLSRSGMTVSERCDAHQDAYQDRMDALEARLNEDYPGYDIPGSAPPAWFDPTYAGESWDGE